MNVQLLKDNCNTTYKKILNDIGNFIDVKSICEDLLDVAAWLVEISKISSIDKAKAEVKARKMLNAAKMLRESGDHCEVYHFLTGDTLQAPLSEHEKTAIIKEMIDKNKTSKPEVEDSVNTGFQFDWDTLPKISFDDVAGLHDVKDAVIRKVLLPLSNPELYEGYVKKNGGGLLLYGPPGTGKTMIAAAIAHEIGAKFCSVGVSDLVLGGIGNSEKAITALFKEARSFNCAVIFFDEMESICPASTRAQHAKQIRSELLRQIQGLDAYGKEDGKILFLIAATNKPWDIDPAFVRPGRFGTRIYVGLPDEKAREYMISSRLEKIRNAGKVTISFDIDLKGIVAATEGFNGADMGNLLDEVQEVSILRSATGEKKVISQADFVNVLSRITSSVQKKDLEKLEEWREENG